MLLAHGPKLTAPQGLCRIGVALLVCLHLGVSETRGPKYSSLKSRILNIRTPNKVALIFGNPYLSIYRSETRSLCCVDRGTRFGSPQMEAIRSKLLVL